MLKPITCGQCKKAVGWYDTKFYNVVKPEMPAGVIVLVAVIECKCGSRHKFNGMEAKRRANRLSIHERGRELAATLDVDRPIETWR